MRILAIIGLLALNGFFVAVEFALVRSRRTRLEAMTRTGDRKARMALRATNNLSRVLSASQLGITVASLCLGWAAESTVGHAIEAWFAMAHLPATIEAGLQATIAAALALVVVTYLHVVFGELAPRAAALNHPETFARWLAPPLLAFAWVVKPFTWLLNNSARLVLKALGQPGEIEEEAVHSPDELRMLVEQSQERGAIEQQDAALIEGVFEFSEKNARDVMTPRTEIVAVALDASLEDTLATVEESGFSRFPVYEDTIDQIVGLVHAKDLIPVFRHKPATFSVATIMRNVHVVPGTREVEEVLSDFKRMKEHMAVVLDEYGGTAGIVTMEDLLEEIVGEILDEYDEAEVLPAALGSGEAVVDGSMHIADLNERYALSVPEEDYTTIGGFVFGTLGRLPVVGDRITAGGAAFTVSRMDGRRIDCLSVDLHSVGDRRAKPREVAE